MPTAQADSLLYEGVFRIAGWRPTITAFEDLKAAGQLGLVRSPDLRIALQEMDGNAYTMRRNLDALERMQERMIDPLPAERTNFTQLMHGFGIESTMAGSRRSHAGLLESPDVQGILGFKIGMIRLTHRDRAALRESMTRVLQLIEERLAALDRPIQP